MKCEHWHCARVFTRVLIKFLCALANDHGDVKSGLLAPSQQSLH